MSASRESHRHKTLEFPEDFLWGAATAAFQVEGNDTNTDWWAWENAKMPPEKRSGLADDHYNRYESDFDLAKGLNHNAHRLSVEWARIEPEEGVFDEAAIAHYKAVLKSLKDRNITVMVTLWHFTNPIWFDKKGAWLNHNAPKRFKKFVERIVPELDEYVDLWITINEPSGYAYDAYGRGKFPPQKIGKLNVLIANWNFAQAHKAAYKIIHKHKKSAKVGIAHNVCSFSAFHKHSLREAIVVWFLDLLYNHTIYKMTGMDTHDFLGLNYYFNYYVSFNGERARLPSRVDVMTTKKDVSDLGWEIYPQGMFDVLMDMSDYHKPIYITENGLASLNDDRRTRFLISYLQEVYHAIATGVKVKGYFHWSLLDNYEWIEGFDAQFGLIEVNKETQERTVKPSAHVYADIIKHNGIPHDLLKLLGHSVRVEEVLKEHQS